MLTPRRLYGMFPQSIECQLHVGNAGDFWCIGEDVTVPDMEQRRGPRDRWGVDGDKARRIVNLGDGAEKPAGLRRSCAPSSPGARLQLLAAGVRCI